MNVLLILLGKLLSILSRYLNLGSGSTWPGHIALIINPNFIKDILRNNYTSNEVRSSRSARTINDLRIILIAGTNGKTTTGKLIQTILEKANYKVFQNEAGANLLNGIASSLLLHSNILSAINYDYAIFEADENTLPLALKEISPDYLILLNLFRDQLDRYGEVNTIASKWKKAIDGLSKKTRLILNADDPQIASLGVQANTPRRWIRSYTSVFYFGIKDKKLAQTKHQHAVDSTYCPNCNSRLSYLTIYYSHLGDWECKKCGLKRPKYIFSTPPSSKLTGTYNLYNTLAATLVAKKIGISDRIINNSLKTFTPAFGRQEILKVDGKKVQIFLSKNPTSFNESLRAIAGLEVPARNALPRVAGGKNVLFVLNDRIPDGRDVSWIWDVDFEDYVEHFKSIIISGDRCFDLGLRIKYSTQKSKIKNQNFNSKIKIYERLDETIKYSLKALFESETLYILPTYSAMLEVRKILTGKKIL